jgi:ABC-type Fe3+-siderophore transport system permease subunit
MSESRARIGNFLKVFSMITVIGSLLYMYGYNTERTDLFNDQPGRLIEFSKEKIFYVGLGFFVTFNLIVHLLIYLYNNAKGIDPESKIFRSKKQKSAFSAGLSFILAGINIFIASMILYIAFIKINEVSGQSAWIYIPIVGFAVLLISATGLIRAFMTK